MTEYAQAKTREYPRDIPKFSEQQCCKRYFKDNKHNNLHLAWIYVPVCSDIFCLGALYVPWSLQFSSCYALRRLLASWNQNFRRQVCKLFFMPNWGNCLFSPWMEAILLLSLNYFCDMLLPGNITCMFPNFSWGIFSLVMHVDQLHVSKNIWSIIISVISIKLTSHLGFVNNSLYFKLLNYNGQTFFPVSSSKILHSSAISDANITSVSRTTTWKNKKQQGV